jgi:hypothetical protein
LVLAGCIRPKIRKPLLGSRWGFLLVVPFQAARWDDPEKLLRSQGFRLPGDPESQVAVLFADAKTKDLFEMQKPA